MTWQEFTALLVLATAMSFSPGPNTTLSTALAANGGLRHAMRFVLAVPVGWCLLLLLCAAGVGALVVAVPVLRGGIKAVGAAYLLWLGLRLLLARGDGALAGVVRQTAGHAAVPVALKEVFLGGFWTNVLNPKVAIFFLAFVPQFIAPGADNKALAFVLLGVLFNLNAIPVNVGWALAASWMARRAGVIQRGMHWLDRVAGAMFIGFGLKLAFTDQPSA